MFEVDPLRRRPDDHAGAKDQKPESKDQKLNRLLIWTLLDISITIAPP